ncbi:hypothetical protein AB0E04_03740 [Streptomyces sp. NPDC048251]|uniref:DUF6907 domain-containing protein n=1 Tax=Streptomyces sp. NPDC048251 TaxID=3154501 RepID=UPI00342B9BD2
MTGPRTVHIRTIDHGTVTVVCPDWCTDDHEQDVHRVDITHTGADQPLTLPTRTGPVTHLVTALEVRPFVDDPFFRTVFVSVEFDGDWHPTGLAGLEAMADQLAEHAEVLRERARELAALLAEGHR